MAGEGGASRRFRFVRPGQRRPEESGLQDERRDDQAETTQPDRGHGSPVRLRGGPRIAPRFERAVILIVEHGPDGALGIVINKPVGEQPLASVFKTLGQKEGNVAGSVRVFSGGPVQPEVGFVVHSPDYRRPETVAITDRLSMTSSVAILQDIGDKRGPAKVLVAFGYAGWGPDQLEHEIEERAWGIAEADPTLVFDEDRDNVWEDAWKHRTEHL